MCENTKSLSYNPAIKKLLVRLVWRHEFVILVREYSVV